jgi:uncharacterized membrane protein YkvA (DUF1232 family)
MRWYDFCRNVKGNSIWFDSVSTLKERARQLKSEVHALYLAARHPHTPWYAKLCLVAIVAYVLSPIDLIPDFVPVLGLLDEVVLLPFAIRFAVRLVPDTVMAECRARASRQRTNGVGSGRVAAVLIVCVWLILIVWCASWVYELAE